MSALLKKEFRLLAPGFLSGIALALVVLVMPDSFQDGLLSNRTDAYLLLICGVSLIALGAFGREFTSGTFSMMLAQPESRGRIWRSKALMPAAMIGIVWVVWFAAWLLRTRVIVPDVEPGDLARTSLALALAIYSGGLWSVLLLRQVTTAIWFTLLIPILLPRVAAELLTKDPFSVQTVQYAALAAYSIAGFIFARWLFFRAQDAQWTGGHIGMPEVSGLGWGKGSERRARRPLAALWMKEIQLHQGQYLVAGVLLLVHIGTIAARKFGTYEINSPMLVLLNFYWVFWLLMPLLIGCTAVAEERKTGTLEGQLCLPVGRRTQFAVKCSVVIILSVLLGGGMPLLLENWRIPPTENSDFAWQFAAIVGIGAAICAGIGGLAFYVSTLSRNTLQALAPAVPVILLVTYLLNVAYMPENLPFIRIELWRGALIYLIGVPVMVAACVALAYSNFKEARPGWKAWRNNLLALALCAALVTGATTVIYHRTWELFGKLEPPHGTARLKPGEARLRTDYSRLSVLLPDGRAWVGHYETFSRPALWKGNFLEGTDWADIAIGRSDIAAIRRDGSLWVSEKPRTFQILSKGEYIETSSNKLVQVGEDHDWKTFGLLNGDVLLLLKTNGTLWYWGHDSSPDGTQVLLGMRHYTPRQLGTDADWVSIFSMLQMPYLRKANGEIWSHITQWDHSINTWDHYTGEILKINSDYALGRVSSLDGQNWKGVVEVVAADFSRFRAGVYEDGSFREMARHARVGSYGEGWIATNDSNRIGEEKDWLKAITTSYWNTVFTLKADGTIWQWDFKNAPDVDAHGYSAKQFGEHSDWVDIEGGYDVCTVLAADGSLWQWRFEPDIYDSALRHPLLRESRRPQYLGNIFDGKK